MSKNFGSIASFTEFLEATTARMALLTTQAAELGSFVLYEHIYNVYGDNTRLEPLAEWTQDEREKLGFSTNEPLLRDGSLLRDHEERDATVDVAAVGNTEIESLYHEMGYLNARTNTLVPARPVHKIGLDESQAEIEALLLDCGRVAMGERPQVKVTKRVA